MDDIILVGFGGHAKSVIDCIEQGNRYHIIGFTEVQQREPYHGYACLGTDDVLEVIYKRGIRFAFVCLGYMGNSDIRDALYRQLKSVGFSLPVISDPTSIVSKDAVIEEGVFIGKQAVVNVGAHIGKMGIINTGAIIEHEVHVGEYTHVAVGATLCGNADVGDHCLIGANSTIIQGIRVGASSIVGAGSLVLRDVRENEKVYGIVKE